MKVVTLCTLLCGMYASAFGQTVDSAVTIAKEYRNRFVQACDSISYVSNRTAKMAVATQRLPKPIVEGSVCHYHLSLHGVQADVAIKKSKTRLQVSLNDRQKHCFIVDTSCTYSFESFDLDASGISLYGKLQWGKFYRNFNLILYSKNTDAYFDFDDAVQLNKHSRSTSKRR